MKTLTPTRAIRNLTTYIIEKRLVTGSWSKTEDGKELGCLLHALGNSEYNITSPEECPASVMPGWVAQWVPGAFDEAGKSNMYIVAENFRDTLKVTKNFTTQQWEKLRVEFLCRQIDLAIDGLRPISEKISVWEKIQSEAEEAKAALRSGNTERIAKINATAWATARDTARATAWATEATALATALATARDTARATAWATEATARDTARADQFGDLLRLATDIAKIDGGK